jgi:murein DD-endopeptidase MepM/ murein hydrolase activator NlpD
MKFIGKLIKSPRLFTGISWGITAILVVSMLGYGLWRVFPPTEAVAKTIVTPAPGSLPALPASTSLTGNLQAIVRHVWLKTDSSQRMTYDISAYTVQAGDALFSIAKQFNIKPETLLWANSDVLKDNPDNLVTGEQLVVPPADGVYYQWKNGDTFESVAKLFSANADDIINWPGNNIDLSNPTIKPGTFVLVPGGHRELVQWIVPQVARGRSGTAGLGGASCNGPVGSTAFQWPTNNHSISGYNFSPTHLGIDISAQTGDPIYAADSGVVVVAGWSNSGYGNVIMIDHGNGYSTVYGHLSQINVSLCQGVNVRQLIGRAGDTGNAFGSHLHFEVRLNGGFVDPNFVLPPP